MTTANDGQYIEMELPLDYECNRKVMVIYPVDLTQPEAEGIRETLKSLTKTKFL